jgi:hypothetical protein
VHRRFASEREDAETDWQRYAQLTWLGTRIFVAPESARQLRNDHGANYNNSRPDCDTCLHPIELLELDFCDTRYGNCQSLTQDALPRHPRTRIGIEQKILAAVLKQNAIQEASVAEPIGLELVRRVGAEAHSNGASKRDRFAPCRLVRVAGGRQE